MKIAFIDHYDSFSFNVLDWLRDCYGSELEIKHVLCDDEIGLLRAKKENLPLVISPGPGSPHHYPATMSLINAQLECVPIFGICLGHQMLGLLAGCEIVRAKNPWHGTRKSNYLTLDHWLVSGVPTTFNAVSYNSLVIQDKFSPDSDWQVAGIDDENQISILAHRSLPIGSVQFHPESFDSDDLTVIGRNFLKAIK